MGGHGHQLDSSLEQSHASSGNPADDRRLTEKSGTAGEDPAEKEPEHDVQNKAETEEFGERGMGVAGKE